ncbi:hypothetical protein Ciccas_013306 [Cichlidogyrus casuarinus]|uniref:WW domain-containing protein n=1 Tax=Cichlidogyrus casuarinus TaxID=1844966 RepID=A0ABD2PKX4_9PLAT
MSEIEPLPLGWEVHLDNRINRYYFVDHNTRSTHWKHPVTQKIYWPVRNLVNEQEEEQQHTPEAEQVDFLTFSGYEEIDRVIDKARNMHVRILDFRGSSHEKNFIELNELLDQMILTLDGIKMDHAPEMRQCRRKTIRDIQYLVELLELKANSMDGLQTSPTPNSLGIQS